MFAFVTDSFASDFIETCRDNYTPNQSRATDQSQPDTLRLDDTYTLNQRFTAYNQWPAVRFSPIGTYQVRSVYIQFNNVWNSSDTMTIFAVADSVNGSTHLPNMSMILGQISGIRVPNPTPPATSVWLDVDFPAPFTRQLNQDFWIVYGVCPAGAIDDSGFWPLFDISVSNSGKSLYVTGNTTPTVNSGWVAVFGYDWRCRVGGAYTNLRYVDLQSQFLYATSQKFHLATGFTGQSFKAVIRNSGTDTVQSYTVTFTGKSFTNAVVWTSTVNRGRILPGAVDTVAAGSNFAGMAADIYKIQDSVSTSNDLVPGNNSSFLEQYVYNASQPFEYRYDNSQINVNYSPGTNSGVMVRYKPDNYPVEIDSVILMYSGTAPFVANLYIYGDSIGTTGPRNLLYSQQNVRGSAYINRVVIPVPAIKIVSGSYCIGFICDSNFVVGYNCDNPLASQNLLMGTQRYFGTLTGNTLNWVPDIGPELTIRASIKRTPNLSVTLTPSGTGSGYTGNDVWYPMTIQNTGQSSDSYNLTTTGNLWTTQIWNSARTSQISMIGPISSAGSQGFYVKVTIPSNAANGAVDTAVIHATSRTTGTITSAATKHTQAIRYIDLQSQYLFSTSQKFYLASGFAGQRYKAIIQNNSIDTIPAYSVIFVARNSNQSVVWTSTANCGSIAPNAVDTVQAPVLFAGMGNDSYTIQDSVAITGDLVASNNTSLLEQYVYDPTQAKEFRYDDGSVSTNQTMTVNTGIMVRYQPDYYPTALDSVILYKSGTDTFIADLYVYTDSAGITVPRTLIASQTHIRESGSRVALHITPTVISSGSFYIGLICDSNLTVGINNNSPVACQNLMMGYQRFSGTLTGQNPVWNSVTGFEPMIHASIRAASVSVYIGPTSIKSGLLGNDVWYPLVVRNTGEVADSYNLSLSGNSFPTQIWNSNRTQQITSIGPIAPSSSQALNVKVSIPANAQSGIHDIVYVQTTSQLLPSVSSRDTINTHALGFVAPAGGPDGWGYRYATDRDTNGAVWTWVDTANAIRLPDQTGNLDDYNWQIVLPSDFHFKYYGRFVDTIWVGINGFLILSPQSPGSTFPINPTAMASAPNAYIGAFHTDLIYGDSTNIWGGVYTKMVDSAQHRQFVVTWVNMKHHSAINGTPVTFQVAFDELHDKIEIRYQSGVFGNPGCDFGVNGTFGIKSWMGMDTLCYSIPNDSFAAVTSQSVVDYICPLQVAPTVATASISGNHIVLQWDALGAGVTNYTILADTTNPHNSSGGWFYLGSTNTTTYTDFNAILLSPCRYYTVSAIEQADSPSRGLVPLEPVRLHPLIDRCRVIGGFGTPKPNRTNYIR